jgi:hypothetical protein
LIAQIILFKGVEMNFRYLRGPLAAAAALVAFMALTPPTAGATTTPASGYEQFAGCPNPGQNPLIEICFRTVITGGQLQAGEVEIPIAHPMALSGGRTESGGVDFNSVGGLPPVQQGVPGGLIGLTGLTWLNLLLGVDELAVHAVIELAGTPSDPLAEPLSLPVKVHLINSALGSNCYIGSNAEPIQLELITETTSPPSPNSPITGTSPTISITPDEVVDFSDGTYVDNSFAAPGVSGCVLALFGAPSIDIDSLIESQSGLPAAAGTNTTTQDFDTEFVLSELVYP